MEINLRLTDKALRDYELVKAALERGEQNAYAELMRNYRDSLYFMMLKMTNNPQDADDLTIEAFGKAFKNLRQYTPDYAFSTWLFKIASNNCIDFIRKRKMNESVSVNLSDPLETGDDLADISSGYFPDTRRRYYQAAENRGPERYRQQVKTSL